MTVFEMQQLFQTLLETTNPLYDDMDKPDTDTILRYLNLGQIEYIKERYLSAPTFVDRARVLGSNILDLGTLIGDTTLDIDVTVTAPLMYSIVLHNVTDKYWHIIKVIGQISRTLPKDLTTLPVQLRPINVEDVDRYLTTINNYPILLVPVFYPTTLNGQNEPEIIVICDKYTTYFETEGTTKMVYLKNPRVLDLTTNNTTYTTTCELAEYLHTDLVKYSLGLFEQEKYKLSSKKEDKTK